MELQNEVWDKAILTGSQLSLISGPGHSQRFISVHEKKANYDKLFTMRTIICGREGEVHEIFVSKVINQNGVGTG